MLNKEDKELIFNITELTKKIFKIYNILFELEINNKKDDIEYKKNLKYLDLLLELEIELYSKIPINKIESYISYSDRANIYECFSDFTLIINDYHDNYIYKRIYNRFKKIRESNLIKKYQENESEKNEPFFDLNNLLFQIIHEDMLNSFIYETDKLKKEINNNDYKNGLTMIKYIVSFLNSDIEKEYKNKFNIDTKLFIRNRLVSDNFNIDEKDYLNTFKLYYYNNIHKIIKNITKNDLYTSDYAFQNYRFLLQKCLIKALNNISFKNTYLKYIIHDIIKEYNIDIDLNLDNNIVNIRSERLKVYGSSK